MKTTRFFVTRLFPPHRWRSRRRARRRGTGFQGPFPHCCKSGRWLNSPRSFLDGVEIGIAMVNDAGGIGGLKARLWCATARDRSHRRPSAPRS